GFETRALRVSTSIFCVMTTSILRNLCRRPYPGARTLSPEAAGVITPKWDKSHEFQSLRTIAYVEATALPEHDWSPETSLGLIFVRAGDVGHDHDLDHGRDIDPLQLEADAAVGKTKQVGMLLIGLRGQKLSQSLCCDLKSARIEIHDRQPSLEMIRD